MNQKELIQAQVANLSVSPKQSFLLEVSERDDAFFQTIVGWVRRVGFPIIGCFLVVIVLSIGLRLFETHVIQQSEFSELTKPAEYLKNFYFRVPDLLA